MVQAKFFIMLIICIIFFICAWRFVLKCYIRSRSEIQDQDMDFVNRNVNDEINKSLELIKELENVVREIQISESLFSSDIQSMSLAHKQSILNIWVRYVGCYNGLNELRKRYKKELILKKNKDSHSKFKSVLLIYASTIAIRKNSVLLAKVIDKNKYLEPMLNEGRPEHNINKKQYYYITQEITEIYYMISLFKNKHYFDFMVNYYEAYGYKRGESEKRLLDYSSHNYLNFIKLFRNHKSIIFNNMIDFLGKNAFDFWFPVQKWLAISITGVDYSRRKEKYVSSEDIYTIKEELLPGDILLKRDNFQLTNMMLSGFWTHSGIYIGTLEQLDIYFKDMPLGEFLCVSEYVKATYPEVYDNIFNKRNSDRGYIIEVIAPGVVINPLEAIAKVDYFSALRPKLSKEDKLKALFTAFESLGKAYDYNFDIMTDSALFCSELVYKAYLCSSDKKGLTFDLEPKAGRLLLSPNNIIRKFDIEFDCEDAEFDFVLFYDGSEKEKKAIRKNATDLKVTWKISKWRTVKRKVVLSTEARYPVVKFNSAVSKLKIIFSGMFY